MAESYVAGSLSGAEMEAFELHFFECSECLEEVRALQLSREALERDEALRGDLSVPRAARMQWLWWAALAAAAALSIVAIRLHWFGSAKSGVEPAASVQSPGAIRGQEEAPSESPIEAEVAEVDAMPGDQREMLLASLAVVDPPPYERIVVRGVGDEASRQFDRGMAAYLANDFAAAVGPLQLAAASNPERPDVGFYHGVSLLLTNALDDAIAELSRVVSMGDPVFSEEAHFYLAMAYLRSGNLELATVELQEVAKDKGPLASEAAEILVQLDALR